MEALQMLRKTIGGREAMLHAVYDYWAGKRKRTGKPMMRRLQAPTPANDTNPYNVFRWAALRCAGLGWLLVDMQHATAQPLHSAPGRQGALSATLQVLTCLHAHELLVHPQLVHMQAPWHLAQTC